MSCFVNGSLLTEVLPLSGCLTFLKASDHLVYRPDSRVGGHAYRILNAPYVKYLDVLVLD